MNSLGGRKKRVGVWGLIWMSDDNWERWGKWRGEMGQGVVDERMRVRG